MKLAIALCTALLIGTTSHLTLAKSVVDVAQLSADNAYKKELSRQLGACKKKFKTVGDRENCRDDALDKARAKYPRRGTDDYSKRTYGKLTPMEAENALAKLHGKFRVATAEVSGASVKPGVLIKQDLVKEAVWIHEHVLKTPVTPQLQAVPWVVPCKQMTGLQKRVADRYIAMCPLADAEGTSMDRSR